MTADRPPKRSRSAASTATSTSGPGAVRPPSRSKRIKVQLRDWFFSLRDSATLKVFILCLVVYFIFSEVYAIYEGVSVFHALFFVFIGLLGEYGASPKTPQGYISILIVMLAGLFLLAVLIGEISRHFLDALLNRNKIKIKKRYWGAGHILVLGTNMKLYGILKELRSDDLEKESHRSVVILAPNIDEVMVKEPKIKKHVIGIVGDPLRFEDLARAGLERATSVVLLSSEEKRRKEKLYGDTNTVLIYNTLFNYLKSTKARLSASTIHVVIEFLEDDINLLPFGKATVAHPEVYYIEIPGKQTRLIIEPVYLEKMPNYLFVQSLFVTEMNEIIQRLLSTQFSDSNEFYYLTVPEALVGKRFFAVEKVLLNSNTTPIGILRDVRGVREIIINPKNGNKALLRADDQIVVIAYSEGGARRAQTLLDRSIDDYIPPSSIPIRSGKATRKMPFHKLVICNWHRDQVKDILTELTKVCEYYKRDGFEVRILSSLPSERLGNEIEAVRKRVAVAAGCTDTFPVTSRSVEDPFRLQSMIEGGIRAEEKSNLRVMVLSEEQTADENPDMKTLYQALLIENKISREIVTAVEVFDSRNYEYFKNTSIDVVVSINDFSEKIIAQALLKPYVTLIFRNLLSFSTETNEFYLREIPKRFVGRPIKAFMNALIGHPVIFIAYGRRNQDGEYEITINPKTEGSTYDSSFISHPRVFRSDRIEDGDVAFMISYDPDAVDSVLHAEQCN